MERFHSLMERLHSLMERLNFDNDARKNSERRGKSGDSVLQQVKPGARGVDERGDFLNASSPGKDRTMADYIPTTDLAALNWMQAFASGIASDAAAYQLSGPDVTTINNAVDAYQAALAISSDPSTRTAGTIATKSAARRSATGICRQYAIGIKNNAGISDANKIDIGVRPVNTSRTPVNVPASSPLVNVLGATPGSQTVRYADSNTPASPAKPAGAVQLQLFLAVAAAPATDPAASQLYGSFTKNPIGVEFNHADDGKVATYFARWVSLRGDVGPWSDPVSFRIAA
jgi:hypothetical protein